MQDAQNTEISNEYRSVPISILVESATNPRKRFDEKNLEELAASMKAQGILASSGAGIRGKQVRSCRWGTSPQSSEAGGTRNRSRPGGQTDGCGVHRGPGS